MKSVNCEIDETVIESLVCRLKPTRDGRGNVTIHANVKLPLKDVWAQFILFYKQRVYQRFIVDLDVDYCKLMRKNGIILIVEFLIRKERKANTALFLDFSVIGLVGEVFLQSLEKEAPGLVHNCPYVGFHGVQGLNVDRLLSSLMPHMLPYGLYKIYWRMHRADNSTIITIEFIFNIGSVTETMKRSKALIKKS